MDTMITKVSFKQQVYDYLKDAIVRGKLAVGTVYSEQMIADELQVSRTPVREAIQLLKHENLVEIYSNRGFGVKKISTADIEEIIEARIAVEGFGIRKLARECQSDMAADVLDRMAACIEETKKAAALGQQYEFTTADVAFHQIVVSFTKNPYLLKIADMIRAKQEQATVHSLHDADRMAKAMREHERILQCIRVGDEEAAIRAFEEHMEVTRDILLAAEEGIDK